MISIGDQRPAKANGTWWQVDVSSGKEVVVRFNSSAVKSGTTKNNSGAVLSCRISLEFSESAALGHCTRENQISVAVGTAEGHEPTCIFRGAIDYVATQRENPTTPYQVEIHARGPGARLLDQGYRGEVAGTLSQIVMQLCSDEPVVKCGELPGFGNARAWIDVGSTFGALQLLAASVGAVVTNDGHEGFTFTTQAAALAEMNARRRYTIDARQLERVSIRQGIPVRGIAGGDEDDEG